MTYTLADLVKAIKHNPVIVLTFLGPLATLASQVGLGVAAPVILAVQAFLMACGAIVARALVTPTRDTLERYWEGFEDGKLYHSQFPNGGTRPV